MTTFHGLSNSNSLLGFPLPDDDVREFLTSPLCYANQKIHESSYIRARRFLRALFGVTTTTLADLEPILDDGGGVTRKNIITKFREFMSEGQLMNSSGEKQRNFYQAIVDEASRSSVRIPVFLSVISDSWPLF